MDVQNRLSRYPDPPISDDPDAVREPGAPEPHGSPPDREPSEPRESRLLERVRDAARLRHLSRRTEKAYAGWIRRYILHHGKRHPAEMGAREVTEFLSSLAVERQVSASTQNQALSALLFLYREVLSLDLPWLVDLVRAQAPRRLPVVLTRAEVRAVLDQMHGTPRLVATLLYGGGLRLLEALGLRVKDLDLDRRVAHVRSGKGQRDRMTVVPDSACDALREHLGKVRELHDRDRKSGAGWVKVPDALRRKLPGAGREWLWQWVFPATRTYRHPPTGEIRRHHLHETVVQKGVREGARAAGVAKRVTCHTFRHSFATHLLESGCDIRTIQELLGHKDVRTTMIYTHVLQRGVSVRSPADSLGQDAAPPPRTHAIRAPLNPPQRPGNQAPHPHLHRPAYPHTRARPAPEAGRQGPKWAECRPPRTRRTRPRANTQTPIIRS